MKKTTGILVAVCVCLIAGAMVAESARDFTTVCTERLEFEGRTVQCDYETIQQAVDNADPGDLIVLGPETFYENVVISNPHSLTIRGSGPENTVVDGMDAGIVFTVDQCCDPDQYSTLSDMTIQNGWGSQAGGVYGEHFALHNCVVRDNTGWIGGVLGELDVAITQTLITGNNGWGAYLSGQFYNPPPGPGESLIHTSTVTGNLGGGIYAASAFYGSPVEIYATTVSGNEGTGVRADGGGDVVITTSTIIGNTADDLVIENYSGPSLRIRSSTIGTMQRAHVYWSDVARVALDHTIIETCGDTFIFDSPVDPCYPSDDRCRPFSSGHNIAGDETCRLTHATDMEDTDPLLLPLADNRGPTPTCALLPNSPAIDAGADACEPMDQRGLRRPQDGDFDGFALCDIGAYEYPSFQAIPRE